jgi:hypothetical protein
VTERSLEITKNQPAVKVLTMHHVLSWNAGIPFRIDSIITGMLPKTRVVLKTHLSHEILTWNRCVLFWINLRTVGA